MCDITTLLRQRSAHLRARMTSRLDVTNKDVRVFQVGVTKPNTRKSIPKTSPTPYIQAHLPVNKKMHLVISPPLTRTEMNSTFNDALKLTKKKATSKFKKVFWSATLSSLFWDSFLVWLYAPLVCIWISPPDTSLRSCLSPGLLIGSWRYYFNPIERMILTPGYLVQKFRQFWTLARMWISEAAWRFEAGGRADPSLSLVRTVTQIFQNALCVFHWHKQTSLQSSQFLVRP